MFQLYGSDTRRRFRAIPAVHIEWRSGVSAEADFAPDRRVQSRTATAAEAIMLASDDRTGGAAARDLEPGRRVPILSPGRFVTGTGSQPIAAESIPTSRKPAWTRSLAGTAHPGYSHARQRLPKRLCWQVMTEL